MALTDPTTAVDFRLDGYSVIVTGAARGQGAAEVSALAAAGATVLATDVLDDEGEHLAAELSESCRGRVLYRHHDVADPASWRSLADQARGTVGPVHGLVNNAGIPQRDRVGDVSLADWDRALQINLTGTMVGIQTIAPLMPSGGSIVNVGSVAALGSHHGAAYTASKWGVRGLTRSAAVELGRRGIRVNVVHPGLVETPLTATAPQAFLDAHLSLTPLARPGACFEIATVVLFLLSDAASYITGAEIAVDGGFSAHGGGKLMADATLEVTASD